MPKKRRQAQGKGKVEVMGMDHQDTVEITSVMTHDAIKEGAAEEKRGTTVDTQAKFKKQKMDDDALPKNECWASEMELNHQDQEKSANKQRPVQVTFQDSKEDHADAAKAWDLATDDMKEMRDKDQRVKPTLVRLSEDLQELEAWRKKAKEGESDELLAAWKERVEKEEGDRLKTTVANKPDEERKSGQFNTDPLSALQVKVENHEKVTMTPRKQEANEEKPKKRFSDAKTSKKIKGRRLKTKTETSSPSQQGEEGSTEKQEDSSEMDNGKENKEKSQGTRHNKRQMRNTAKAVDQNKEERNLDTNQKKVGGDNKQQ
jgi:hypothetical protein